MEKTKFIQKEDLADVIETLFSEAIEHYKDINLDVKLRSYSSNGTRPTIYVDVRDASFERLVEVEYEVIDGVSEGYDVERDTIDVALAKIQEKEQESTKEA